MSAPYESHGFSLVELAVTILVLGLVMAFSVPAFQSLNQTNRLHGASENLAGNLRLVREKAIATGQSQVIHFTMNFPSGSNWDYHVHNGPVGQGWELPLGITYNSVTINPKFQRTGLVTDAADNPVSGIVVLRNARGERDTVTIAVSGLVLTQ